MNIAKEKIKKGFHKFFYSWIDILCITLISFLLSNVILLINPSMFLEEFGDGESFTTDLLMHIENKNTKTLSSDYISVVDIGDLKNRGDIAKVLEDVYSMSPRCIGVDIDFIGLQDPAADSTLCTVVDKIKDKTVFVCGLEDENFDSISHSFFCDPHYPLYNLIDSTGKMAVMEGASALIYDIKESTNRTYRNKYNTKEGELYSLTASMVKDIIDANDSEEHIIAFKSVDFNYMQYDSLVQSSIYDRFVLIGRRDKRQDIHKTPLGVLPGIIVHAQTLETILDCRDIKKLDNNLETFLSFLVCLLFCFVLFKLDLWADRFRDNNKYIRAHLLEGGGCSTIIWTFISLFLLLWFAYYLYLSKNIHLRMHIALVCVLSTAIMGRYVYKLFLLVFHKYGLVSNKSIQKLFNKSYYYKKITQ